MSGQRDIRLLLADVDGTLVTQDKVLTDQTVAVAQELREPASRWRSPAAGRRAA